MPRNPRPDTIGMGGRILSVQVAGSPRNTQLADKGINVRVIQALARHKDMSTTQRYIDYNESKLRNAIGLV
jgi:integrase